MDKVIKFITVASVASLALMGCAERYDKPKQTLSPSFGNAVRHNMAVQIINPEGHPDLSPSAMDGARADEAVTRYREGKTKEVKVFTTTDVGDEAK